jgi:hypothetical protein
MASTPNFVATPRYYRGRATAANTARDGTGTIVDIVGTGSGARKIDRIEIVAEGTTTAGIVRLYIWNGTDYRLWREVDVPAITPSGTVDAFRAEVDLSFAGQIFVLESTHKLGFAPHNAETFIGHAWGGDF